MAESDLDRVLEWRNAERIRAAMYTDHIITPEEHRVWFERTQQSHESLHFVFDYDSKPVGVINATAIDRDADRCNWGFYVGAENAPKGVGSAMGFVALEHLFEALGFRKIVGEALAGNEASLRYHSRLGFTEEGRLVEHVIKEGRPVDVISFAIFDRDWRRIKDQLAERLFGESGK